MPSRKKSTRRTKTNKTAGPTKPRFISASISSYIDALELAEHFHPSKPALILQNLLITLPRTRDITGISDYPFVHRFIEHWSEVARAIDVSSVQCLAMDAKLYICRWLEHLHNYAVLRPRQIFLLEDSPYLPNAVISDQLRTVNLAIDFAAPIFQVVTHLIIEPPWRFVLGDPRPDHSIGTLEHLTHLVVHVHGPVQGFRPWLGSRNRRVVTPQYREVCEVICRVAETVLKHPKIKLLVIFITPHGPAYGIAQGTRCYADDPFYKEVQELPDHLKKLRNDLEVKILPYKPALAKEFNTVESNEGSTIWDLDRLESECHPAVWQPCSVSASTETIEDTNADEELAVDENGFFKLVHFN